MLEQHERIDEDVAAERARALGAPVRLRILRACLEESYTNKDLAEMMGLNPGSMLHHVRTLVDAGFLAPEEPRRGLRNAVEIPYRATELVWSWGGMTVGEFLTREN